MPTSVPIACSVPRCPGYAVARGRCARHRQSTTERGYGITHQRERERLARTLPAPCGYCGRVIRTGEDWVAAHRVDGQPEYGWMVSHPDCNERAKVGGRASDGALTPTSLTRAPIRVHPQNGTRGPTDG